MSEELKGALVGLLLAPVAYVGLVFVLSLGG